MTTAAPSRPVPTTLVGQDSSRRERRRVAGYGVTAGALILAFVFSRFTVDDAFISWRYGQTLAESGVWNWNGPGAPLVEAYTNPLFTGLSVLPALLGLPPELFFKLVAAGLLIAYALVVRRLGLPRPQTLALYALAALNPVFHIHLFGGLETASFALLVALLFGLVYRRGSLGIVGHMAALAVALTRPEGMVYAAVAELWALGVSRRRRDAYGAALVAVILAGYWGARAWYFGRFFPNTFYVKSTGKDNWIDAVRALPSWALVAAALAVCVMVVLARPLLGGRGSGKAGRLRVRCTPQAMQNAVPLLLAMLSAAVVLAVYQTSSLVMNYAGRAGWQVMFPVALVLLCRPLRRGSATRPFVCAAALAVALEVLTAGAGTVTRMAALGLIGAATWLLVRRVRRLGPGMLLAVACTVALAVSATAPTELTWASSYRYRLENAHGALGRALAAEPSLSGTLAVGDAGLLPLCLRGNQQVVDLLGLANPHLDGRPAHRALTSVVLFARPEDPDGWRAVHPGARPFVAAAQGTDYHSAGLVPIQQGAWFDVRVRQDLAPVLRQRLPEVTERAAAENLRSDLAVLRSHLLDLPYLRSGQCGPR
ncbi:hypothetical protein [Streptomyces mesophilus]|uniref:hypothetical protein n=1 Tax=Streptomyces mesophilus TaxID=1775132 RepID=UPI003324CBCD